MDYYQKVWDYTRMSIADLRFFATIQHDAGQIDHAIEFVKQMVELKKDLKRRDRDLFMLVYKEAVDRIRTTLKVLTDALSYEERKNDTAMIDRITSVRRTTLVELRTLCLEVTGIVEKELLPNAKDDTSRAFFEKIRGDMYRYICEYTDGDEKDKAYEAYSKAMEIAKSSLSQCDPVHLSTVLNFAVFTYESLEENEKAISMLKDALAEAETGYDQLSNEMKEEHAVFLDIMQNNLANWLAQEEEDSEDRA